jgi:hypothetical protein
LGEGQRRPRVRGAGFDGERSALSPGFWEKSVIGALNASRGKARVLEGETVICNSARLPRVSVVMLLTAFLSFSPLEAKADVSSWLTLGPGVNKMGGLGWHRDTIPSLRLGTGMGTDPSHAFVLGGFFRLDTLFDKGTDLSLSLRFADHGFANGQWGFAIDAGPLARFWGETAYGATVVGMVGLPWGFEIGLQAAIGEERIRTYGGFAALDLARLTVYRRSGSSYWKNRFPAYRTPEEEQH